MFHVNYIKVLFGFLNFAMFLLLAIFFSSLENYLPLYVKRVCSYGKVAHKYKGSERIQPIQVPKKWFRHFYIYSTLLSTCGAYLVISTLIFDVSLPPLVLDVISIVGGSIIETNVSGGSALIAICLFTLHCWRRMYESHFVSVFANDARLSLYYYVLAYIYYTGCVLAILIETPKFNKSTWHIHGLDWADFTFIDVMASILFFWGYWHQHKSAVILANLRKDKTGTTITQSYKLPHGDWFEYVSSPHLSAEIVIYFALKIILRNNSTWTYVLIWVIISQTELAITAHRWYQNKFKEMPKSRKAVIPFVY